MMDVKILDSYGFHTFLSRHPVLLVFFFPGKDIKVGVDKQSAVACYEAGHVFGCHRLQKQCDWLRMKIKRLKKQQNGKDRTTYDEYSCRSSYMYCKVWIIKDDFNLGQKKKITQ